MERIKSSTRTHGSRNGCIIQSLVSPPYVDAHMGRPRHVPFGFWESGPSYPRAQALSAVESCRMGQHFPLEAVVGEPVGDLNLHRQQRDRLGVPGLRRVRLGLPLGNASRLFASLDHLGLVTRADGDLRAARAIRPNTLRAWFPTLAHRHTHILCSGPVMCGPGPDC
jgi:hypothetical protein